MELLDFHRRNLIGFDKIYDFFFIILYVIRLSPLSAWFNRLYAFICIQSKYIQYSYSFQLYSYDWSIFVGKSDSVDWNKKWSHFRSRTNLPRCTSCIHFRPWKASLAECQRWSILRWRLMHGRHTLLSERSFSRWCQTFECSWLSSYWTLTLWWSDCSRCRNYFRKTWNWIWYSNQLSLIMMNQNVQCTM